MSDLSILSDDGYLGCLTYFDAKYDIYVRVYEKVNTFLQFPVYQIKKVEITCLENGSNKIKSIIQHHFEQNGMYCSPSSKLCSINLDKEEPSPLFMWNQKLDNLSWYCTFGYINGPLICRRLVGFQGKRFLRRGVLKDKGQIGNELFVQLIQADNTIIKIIRGSAVIQFMQQPCMSRKPAIKVPYQQNQLGVYLDRISPLTGNTPIVFLSLIDNKKDEYKVAQEQIRQFHLQLLSNNLSYYIYEIFPINYQEVQINSVEQNLISSFSSSSSIHPIPSLTNLKMIQKSQILPYKYGIIIISTQYAFIHIDFHRLLKELPKSKFLEDVVMICEHYYGKNNFIPRINCIDSLDRTNAALSCFLKNFCSVQTIIDAGNLISIQYASSEAMKQDIAEFGIRTWKGRFQDLKSVILRYFRNNLCDQAAQDGYRLVLGEYGSNNPESQQKVMYINFYVFTVIYVVCIVVADVLIGVFAKYAAVGIVVFTILAISLYVCIMKLFGRHFVQQGYVQ